MDERRITPERQSFIERPTSVSMEDIRERQAQWESRRTERPIRLEPMDEGVYEVHNFGRTMQEIIGPERYAYYQQRQGRIRIEQASKPSITQRLKKLGQNILHHFGN